MNSTAFRICLIEDDRVLGEGLVERFELEGFVCDWFQTGQAALAPLGTKPYKLVISDIGLPDVDGEQLFCRLQESGRQLPPFIFITGRGAVDRAVRLIKRGAEDYLTKPFDVEALRDQMRLICSRD